MSVVQGLIGTKLGMTSMFDEGGAMRGVTVVGIDPNRVVYTREAERDGYTAAALGYGVRRASRARKPQLGQAGKAGLDGEPHVVREVGLGDGASVAPGDTIAVGDVFSVGDYVDVTGTSRGAGFQGGHKRHNFGLGPASHGSKNRRDLGSTGQATYPGRVFKGKKMAGQMGHKRRTVRNLRVVAVDADNNRLMVAGPVPGWDTGTVLVRHSVTKRAKQA